MYIFHSSFLFNVTNFSPTDCFFLLLLFLRTCRGTTLRAPNIDSLPKKKRVQNQTSVGRLVFPLLSLVSPFTLTCFCIFLFSILLTLSVFFFNFCRTFHFIFFHFFALFLFSFSFLGLPNQEKERIPKCGRGSGWAGSQHLALFSPFSHRKF